MDRTVVDLPIQPQTEKYDQNVGAVESQHIEASKSTPQDLFSTENGDVNLRGVSWQAAAVLIAKLQIGLGALSLPNTFHVLGFFPGLLCFVVLSTITTVAGYVCGNARQYYPQMHSIGDAADLLFGTVGREIVGATYYLYLAMTAGAGMLTTSVALNTLSHHGTCTMVFVAATAVFAFIIGTGFRSLQKVAWISWAGVTCIFVAIWVAAIACLARSRPAAGPQSGPVDLGVSAFPKDTTFTSAMTAVCNQLFAVGASGAFFSISAEMRRPEQFTRSLLWGQGFIVLTCIAIGSIVYAKVGVYLANPALRSAGILIAKVSYGIALPGLLVTAVIFSHTAGKYIFVRILRGSRHLQSNTVTHWTVWLGSMGFTVVFGFIIVCLVPFFSDFLSLVGALVNPILTNIIPGFMLMFYIARRPAKVAEGEQPIEVGEESMSRHWLVDSLNAYKNSWKDTVILVVAIVLIVTGAFIMVGGTYATVVSIKESYDKGLVGSVFSCADNST